MIGVKNGVGHEIRKVVKRIGREIKENTELAEHGTGINNAKSKFSKTKKSYKRRGKSHFSSTAIK